MTDYSQDTLQDLAAQLDKLQDDLERAKDAAATIPGLTEHISEIKTEMRIRLAPYPTEQPSADPAEDGEELTEEGIEQRFEAETQAVRAIIEDDNRDIVAEARPLTGNRASFGVPQTD